MLGVVLVLIASADKQDHQPSAEYLLMRDGSKMEAQVED